MRLEERPITNALFHQATTDVAICLSNRDKMEIKCYLSVVLQSTSSGSKKKCTRISMIFDLPFMLVVDPQSIHSISFMFLLLVYNILCSVVFGFIQWPLVCSEIYLYMSFRCHPFQIQKTGSKMVLNT